MKISGLAGFAALGLAAFLAFGCGSKDSTVIRTDSGKMEVKETKDGEAKWSFEGKDSDGKDISGRYTASEKDGLSYEDSSGQKLKMGGSFNVAELGVPVYPDAKPQGEQHGLRSENDKEVTVMATYTTSDDYLKVTEFYDKKFEGAEKSSFSAGSQLSTYTRNKEGDNISVIVTKTDGVVSIGITRMFKQKKS